MLATLAGALKSRATSPICSADGKQTPNISVQVHTEEMPFKASQFALNKYPIKLKPIQNPRMTQRVIFQSTQRQSYLIPQSFIFGPESDIIALPPVR